MSKSIVTLSVGFLMNLQALVIKGSLKYNSFKYNSFKELPLYMVGDGLARGLKSVL